MFVQHLLHVHMFQLLIWFNNTCSSLVAIGNPRGDENPFLLTMGILWFRVHQYWADKLYEAGKTNQRQYKNEKFKEDEWIFNRARQFTIATYQHVVYNNWLPLFIPRMFRATNGALPAYDSTPGYSAYGGYNPAINPQVAHIFQSAAMRFGHTIVTPGVWRRELRQVHSWNVVTNTVFACLASHQWNSYP